MSHVEEAFLYSILDSHASSFSICFKRGERRKEKSHSLEFPENIVDNENKRSKFSFQVFLLLVKRLASLHYNHKELPPDNNSRPSLTSLQATEKGNHQAISNCQVGRENNNNRRSKTADYDEVDFQRASDCNYIERINETINKSSRSKKNMGSNVSTAGGGGKGLSGRRTQSSSKCLHGFPFFLSLHFILSMHKSSFEERSHELRDSE